MKAAEYCNGCSGSVRWHISADLLPELLLPESGCVLNCLIPEFLALGQWLNYVDVIFWSGLLSGVLAGRPGRTTSLFLSIIILKWRLLQLVFGAKRVWLAHSVIIFRTHFIKT